MTMLSRFTSAAPQKTSAARTNWAGNLTYHTDHLADPTGTTQVEEFVKGHASLRALGTRHSFNGIADSTQNQISLSHFNQMSLDSQAKTVTVGAGVPYGKLAPYIDAKGFALHNLASLPHISVVGACVTGTHGSGVHNGNLSTAVTSFEFVAADGSLHTVSRDHHGDQFAGMVVNLGMLGVITRITLEVQPTYQVAQAVYQDLSFDHLHHHLDDIFSSGYSVSLFSDWQKHRATQVWIKRRVEPGKKPAFEPEFYGAKLATQNLHPITGHSAESCTEQMGVPGPWYERLPHFRMNFTPSSGAELQSEYFVAREDGYRAILAVEELKDRITPHLFVTELRTIDDDHLWISPCYHRPSLTIHFTWKPEWPVVRKILPLIEEKLAPFNVRPHWAKLFTLDAAHLRKVYPKLDDFKALAKQYDPHGKFRNEFITTELYS